jgi:Spy/CpxP family protein refolding chaperone
MSMATLAFAGVLSPQEPTAPSDAPNEGGSPNGRPGRGGNVENRLENLSKQLNLTNEQKEKIRPLLKHEMERIREIRNNTSLTQAEARRRMQTVRKNTNQHIAEILTPEQKKQWRQMRPERRGGGESEGGQGGPGSSGGSNAPAPRQNPPNPN